MAGYDPESRALSDAYDKRDIGAIMEMLPGILLASRKKKKALESGGIGSASPDMAEATRELRREYENQ